VHEYNGAKAMTLHEFLAAKLGATHPEFTKYLKGLLALPPFRGHGVMRHVASKSELLIEDLGSRKSWK